MKKKSAVVVLHEQATDSLILTRRSFTLRHHPGELCFPGGYWETKDKDLWSTALRELNEELGIESGRITLVKELLPEKTLFGSLIYPWLASVTRLFPYEVNELEVDAILSIPMKNVKERSNYTDLVVKHDGLEHTSCQFTASQPMVWGATARIMKQLCPMDLCNITKQIHTNF